MTGERSDHGDSRRTFMKKGSLAAGGLALGLPGSDKGIQEEGDGSDDAVGGEVYNALMFDEQFAPGAMFTIVSPVVDWTPDVPEVRAIDPFNYNSRVIRYLNTDQFRILFVSQEAEFPPYGSTEGYVIDDDEEYAPDETPQPEGYQMHRESTVVEGTDSLVRRVQFSPLKEDIEGEILEIEDWWKDQEEGDS